MKQLRLIGTPDLGVIPFSDATVSIYLQAGTPATIDVPSGATTALFSCGGEYFVAEGVAAALPTATATEGVVERNPSFRTINAGITTLGIVAPVNTYLTVSFYG